MPASFLLRDAQQAPVARIGFTSDTRPAFGLDAASVVIDPEAVRVGRWAAFFTGPQTYDLYHRDGDEPFELVETGLRTLVREFELPEDKAELPFLLRPVEGGAAGRPYGTVVRFETTAAGADGVPAAGSAQEGNRGDGVVHGVTVPSGAAGALAEEPWIIFFLDEATYVVRTPSRGVIAEGGEPVAGTVGLPWEDPVTGVQVTVLHGARPFAGADSIRFDAGTVGVLRGTVTTMGRFGAFLTADVAPPAIAVSVTGQDFADGDPVRPKPTIEALISDESGVDPEDVSVTLSRDGGDPVEADTDEVRVHVESGTSQALVQYQPTLEPGDYELVVTASDLEGQAASASIRFRVAGSTGLREVLNYPNPFRTYTDITVEATGEMDTLFVKIYSLQGRLVRVFEHPPTAGFVRVRWDGRDSEGREVANGVYYGKVQMTAREETDTDIVKLLKLR